MLPMAEGWYTGDDVQLPSESPSAQPQLLGIQPRGAGALPRTMSYASVLANNVDFGALARVAALSQRQQPQQQQESATTPAPTFAPAPLPTSSEPVDTTEPALVTTTVPTTTTTTVAPGTAETPWVRQNDTKKFEPFATVCMLALRRFVPDAKLVMQTPLISLQRMTAAAGLAAATRTLCNLVFPGYSSAEYYQLEEPLNEAVACFLCKETVHIFELAKLGLSQLQQIYSGNTKLAFDKLINTLDKALASPAARQDLNTAISNITKTDAAGKHAAFMDLWQGAEVAAVAHLFAVLQQVSSGEKGRVWIDIIEMTLVKKLTL